MVPYLYSNIIVQAQTLNYYNTINLTRSKPFPVQVTLEGLKIAKSSELNRCHASTDYHSIVDKMSKTESFLLCNKKR